MPASSPSTNVSRPDPPPAARELGAKSSTTAHFVTDQDGVSEVIGFMLTFGIISMILIISMVAFADVQEEAEARVVELHAEAVADRVAGIIVEAALFAEVQGPSSRFQYRLDLPLDFEGADYTVALVDSDADTQPDAVEVFITRAGVRVQAELLQAGGGFAAGGVALCEPPATIVAGPLLVRYDYGPGGVGPCIFIEAAS